MNLPVLDEFVKIFEVAGSGVLGPTSTSRPGYPGTDIARPPAPGLGGTRDGTERGEPELLVGVSVFALRPGVPLMEVLSRFDKAPSYLEA